MEPDARHHHDPAQDHGPERERDLARAATLVRWLDGRYLDPVIGLVLPEAGDLVTAVAGLYLVAIAIRRRAGAVVIARMLLNLGLDLLMGAVPVLGDLADFAFRANVRNLALLRSRSASQPARATDWLIVGGAAVFLLFALALPVIVSAWLIAHLFR
jgi:hypothetical protein